jgi:hypothetical protein
MLSRKQTIKDFARDYFTRVNYVDVYGRNIGYDYSFILAEIKKQFPEARTSRRWLQDMAYIVNRNEKLPARRRSRRALAEGFAMAKLIDPRGLRYKSVRGAVKIKFPDHPSSIETLRLLEAKLRRKRFIIPVRAD